MTIMLALVLMVAGDNELSEQEKKDGWILPFVYDGERALPLLPHGSQRRFQREQQIRLFDILGAQAERRSDEAHHSTARVRALECRVCAPPWTGTDARLSW